jgi:DNA primase
MPLTWPRLRSSLDPARFTIRSAPGLLRRSGDPLAGVLTAQTDVASVLAGLEQRLAATKRRGRARAKR